MSMIRRAKRRAKRLSRERRRWWRRVWHPRFGFYFKRYGRGIGY